ncbi:hypothetical protein D3C77_596650 [compost metagenome]
MLKADGNGVIVVLIYASAVNLGASNTGGLSVLCNWQLRITPRMCYKYRLPVTNNSEHIMLQPFVQQTSFFIIILRLAALY